MSEIEQNSVGANEPSQPSATKLTISFVLLLLTAAYFWFLAIVPGQSDWLFGVLWLTTALTIFYQAFKIKTGLRSAMKDVFDSNSLVYRFLAKKSIIQFAISVFLGCVVSLSFLVTLKLLTLKHELPPTLIVLLLPVIYLSFSRGSGAALSLGKNMKDAQAQEVVAYTSEIFIKAVMIALYIALVFSALDTIDFYQSKVGFFNFAEEAAKQAIPLNSGGHYARTIINFVLILDNFTLAATNELLKALGLEKTTFTPLWFLLISFIFNLLKFIPFCIAYIFVVLSLQSKLLDYAVILYLKMRALWQHHSKNKTAKEDEAQESADASETNKNTLEGEK